MAPQGVEVPVLPSSHGGSSADPFGRYVERRRMTSAEVRP
jgi:hypothetical protein